MHGRPPIADLESALRLARETKADHVVFGTVDEFRREQRTPWPRCVFESLTRLASCVFDETFWRTTLSLCRLHRHPERERNRRDWNEARG